MTVQDLIDKLKTIDDKQLPVYVRSKYSGDTTYESEYPLKINGISEMENQYTRKIDRVVFLY